MKLNKVAVRIQLKHVYRIIWLSAGFLRHRICKSDGRNVHFINYSVNGPYFRIRGNYVIHAHRASKPVSTDALFISRNGGRLTTRAIQNIVKKHIVAAGINPQGLSTHKLRHTAATLMYKYGQQLLGHESIATTAIYTHVDDGQLQAAVNANPLAMMFS